MQVVVDDVFWRDHMPWLVEAFFEGRGGAGQCASGCSTIRDVRGRFLREFNLDARAVPLVAYDVSRGEFRLTQ